MNISKMIRAIELARDGMFVPPELTQEILDQIKVRKNSKIVVFFSYEMLPVLHELKYSDVTLAFDNPRKSIQNIAKHFGYKIIDLKDIEGMKFDVVLGNPPFSIPGEGSTSMRKRNLYPHFFNLALKHSDSGAMIMPRTQKQIQQPVHNRNIIENCYDIMMIDDKTFNIATSVWCVFYDKKIQKRVEDFTKTTKMNDYVWMRGRVGTSCKKWQSETGYDVIHSVRKDGLVILKKKDFSSRDALPESGYAVVFGVTASTTYVVKCQSQMYGGNVFAVWFKTKKEAEDFQKKLDKKLLEVDHLRGNMNVLSKYTLEQIDFA